MSLLMNYNDQRFIEIAQVIFEEQFKRDPKMHQEMDERRKKLMYDDVVYNISFLMTAVHFSDGTIFEEYAKWIYELLCNLMKDLDRDRIMQQMIDHYRIMSDIFTQKASGLMTSEELSRVQDYLLRGIQVTKAAVTDISLSSTFVEGEYLEIKKKYLNAILTNQTRLAYQVIADARKQGIPLAQVFEDILAKVMFEIGELWHKNVITVEKEHYATSVTQTILSGFYDEIFEQPRKEHTLVSCSIGSELHEMGIRMLSDLMEYYGWDTFYLGAALPPNAILAAIEEHEPDIIALSVTMPPYLAICEDIVSKIREKHPQVKIAVGGQAFLSTNRLWDKWNVDFYSVNAGNFAKWANEITRN